MQTARLLKVVPQPVTPECTTGALQILWHKDFSVCPGHLYHRLSHRRSSQTQRLCFKAVSILTSMSAWRAPVCVQGRVSRRSLFPHIHPETPSVSGFIISLCYSSSFLALNHYNWKVSKRLHSHAKTRSKDVFVYKEIVVCIYIYIYLTIFPADA